MFLKKRSGTKENLSLRSHWFRGASVGVLLQIFSLLLTFISSIILARVLGPEGLGKYSYILAIITVLTVVASLGLPTINARLMPVYISDDNWAAARGLLRWSNIIVFVIGVIFIILVIFFSIVFEEVGNREVYYWAAPLIILTGFSNLRQRAIQAFHHPIISQLPELLFKHLTFIIICGGLLMIGHPMLGEVENVMALWFVSVIVSFLSGVILLRLYSPPHLIESKHIYLTSQWTSIAWPILLADLFGVFLGNIDTIMLGSLRTADEVGLYQIALRLSGVLLILLGASNWVLAPWFSKLHAANEIERLQGVVTKTTRVIFVINIILFLPLLIFGEQLIFILFGSNFSGAYNLLIILCIGQLINIGCGPVVNLLAMTGAQRQLAIGVGISAFANLILCACLIPIYGAFGAAVSVALTISIFNIVLSIVVKKFIGIGPTIIG